MHLTGQASLLAFGRWLPDEGITHQGTCQAGCLTIYSYISCIFLKMEDTEMVIVEDNNFLECPEKSWHEQAVEQAV